ncbi:MAG: HAMP domain-containing histidine kinase [Lachnospiraceae bacterium]|nr:HAMP domain-containing histidine kinase [Lachnospiraceae bacterium]
MTSENTKANENIKSSSHSSRMVMFLFGCFIFGSTLITILLSTVTTYYILSYFSIAEKNMVSVSVLTSFLILMLVSACFGGIISYSVIHFPLRPFSYFVNAINKMAEGDFSVRVEENLAINSGNDLARSINRLSEELSNTEMLRSDFINDFSHEFKTPIASIRGFAKILKEGNCTEEEKNEYLEIILEESTRLSNLSSNVLNLNKIERQSIRTNNEEFNFAEMVRRLILVLESKWTKKDLQLDIDLKEINYYGDTNLLSQLCLNLIDNAIKFSHNKGIVEIRLYEADKASDKTLVFSVRDYGIGMSDRDRNRVFDKFYQADSSHSTEGNGLGLSIVKRITELYQGRIRIESSLGQGSLIEVIL